MPASSAADPDPWGIEHRLRRSAADLAATGRDPDLRRIFAVISERRRRRTGRPDRSAPPVAGRVLAVDGVGPTVRILRIGRPPDLTFRAGQHVRLGLPGTRRGKFSIASAPHEDHVELCIQLVAGGRLTPELFGLHPGDTVAIADVAKGAFTLRREHATHLMVATGTGIAPFRSMMRDAWHRRTGDRFIVLHGASYRDELPYCRELSDAANVDYRPTVSRPTEVRNRGWSGLTGRVDELATVVASSLDAGTTHAYVCGNGAMVDAVTQRLESLGFPVAREVYD